MVKKIGKEKTSNTPEPDIKVSARQKIISWTVFIPTLVIVFISLISVVFPALITRTTSSFQGAVLGTDVINPFQTGAFATPLVIINVIMFAIGILYYRKSKGMSLIKSILNFELSKKRAAIVVIIILAIFVGITANSLEKEETWVDYAQVKSATQQWTISDFSKGIGSDVKYFLLSVSLHVFGNIRVVPMISSIALLLLTYFFTTNITQKRFAGVVSMALLFQSDIFISYSTTASYDNTWILLYLFSLYLIEKYWPSSPVSYFLSIFSKTLTAAFLPMSIYFIASSSLPKRSKIYSLVSYGIIIIVLLSVAVVSKTNFSANSIGFNWSEFWQGFSSMSIEMRFDYIVVLFLLPLTVMLFFASRKGTLHANSVMIFILSVLLAAPLLLGLTQLTNQPYRFVSLVVFFSIGVGVLLSNRTRRQVEASSST